MYFQVSKIKEIHKFNGLFGMCMCGLALNRRDLWSRLDYVLMALIFFLYSLLIHPHSNCLLSSPECS